MNSESRLRPRLSAATLVVALMALMALRAVALAADGAIPQGSTDDVVGTIATYGPVIGGMYVLYAVASSLLARYKSSSWLAQGKRLAIVTGALGVIGAGLQEQIAGAPFTLILAAAVAAAFKLITPTTNPNPLALSSEKVATAAASVALKATTFVAILLIASCVSSCGASQGGPTAGDRGAAGVDAGLECEAPNIKNAVDQLVPAFIRFIKGLVRGNGTFDREALKAAAQPFKNTEYQCAMDAAVAAATAPAPETNPGVRSIIAGGDAAGSEALSATWVEIRAELHWSRAYKPTRAR